MHPLYELVLKELRTDLKQMVEEGHDAEDLETELEAKVAGRSADDLLALQEEWWARPSPSDFPYDEPNDWETISAGFPDPESHAKFPGSDDDLADRILAAWLGRCSGCQLGKPLEGAVWPVGIRSYLEKVGSWPLYDYVNPPPDGIDLSTLPKSEFYAKPRIRELARGSFDAVAPDDDIHYALLSQKVLEDHGTDFTTEDVVATIVRHTPSLCIFASGRNMFRTSLFGLKPPHTAIFGNPCRQSLGAMIRCDPWGWGAPANPALAARSAYKDAVATQTRNGIYSGIFFATLMADVLAHGDVLKAIDTAEQYVPPRTRFAEMVRFVKDLCADEEDWEKANKTIYEKYEKEVDCFNHSLPNGAIVLLGLLKGEHDFTKTIGVTVMAGLDTDCTGATAGSIMGCALGTRGIPAHWTEPFNDRIETLLAGMAQLRISEVARRMYEIGRSNARYDR